ncbi:ABC transporter ATP-binding protein [Deinococcus maricopensis]|uniref:Fe(3+)-transporting ATPase n=1 Tax=Deinococcus maricopensis (strain DSM 21211 / LMG 22137 / NRRL B-23946 / LB-34) TaxID=709986 RepID=E8U651_DEIML|nr:ABC transporter ATP-binding protein [Deinococcus maricopensis]ADV66540.1 Fe(3+)-transporting ATPase [Deinococcus maricopensis DSM 21211]
MTSIPLQTNDLRKAYGATLAANDVSLLVPAGRTLALLGPSGCGKSTALRLIAGLERPDAGRVRLGERDVTTLPPEARHLGLVFQDYALFPHLSVLGNVAYGPRARGARRAEAERQARDALALVGLADLAGRRVTELSGGQQQRVALARALAPRPGVLLLDEPLSNLDEQLRHRLREDLRSLFRTAGVTALLVTHDQREALAVADDVALMRAGRVVQSGVAADVFARPATAWAAAFLGHRNLLPETGGQVRLVPEDALQLGDGDAAPVRARVRTDTGETLTVDAPVGALTLDLSAREAAGVGNTLRLRVLPERTVLLPDDR